GSELLPATGADDQIDVDGKDGGDAAHRDAGQGTTDEVARGPPPGDPGDDVHEHRQEEAGTDPDHPRPAGHPTGDDPWQPGPFALALVPQPAEDGDRDERVADDVGHRLLPVHQPSGTGRDGKPGEHPTLATGGRDEGAAGAVDLEGQPAQTDRVPDRDVAQGVVIEPQRRTGGDQGPDHQVVAG